LVYIRLSNRAIIIDGSQPKEVGSEDVQHLYRQVHKD